MPKNHTKALLIIYFAMLVVSIFLLRQVHNIEILPKWLKIDTSFEIIQFIFLYLPLSIAYITTYSAIEVDSPSLTMTLKIAEAGINGLDKGELESQMSDEILLTPRIKDLLKAGLALKEGDRYKITKKGVFIVSIFILYRKLLSLAKGG